MNQQIVFFERLNVRNLLQIFLILSGTAASAALVFMAVIAMLLGHPPKEMSSSALKIVFGEKGNEGRNNLQSSITEEDAKKVLNTFIDAWANKDSEKLRTLLASDFQSTSCVRLETGVNRCDSALPKSPSHNRDAFIEGKNGIFSDQSTSSFEVIKEGEAFELTQDGGVIRYNQRYVSQHYKSLGTNELHLRKNENGIKILKEIFYCDQQTKDGRVTDCSY